MILDHFPSGFEYPFSASSIVVGKYWNVGGGDIVDFVIYLEKKPFRDGRFYFELGKEVREDSFLLIKSMKNPNHIKIQEKQNRLTVTDPIANIIINNEVLRSMNLQSPDLPVRIV